MLRSAAVALPGRDLIRRGALAVTRRLADRLGFDLVHRDYYSPVPDVGSLPEEIWGRRSPLCGITWTDETQLAFLEHDLIQHLRDFQRRSSSAQVPGYTWDNGSYGPLDAHVLWAIIRHVRPVRILELGAGVSTFVTAAACHANGSEGHRVRFVSADPFPAPSLAQVPHGLDELLTVPSRKVPSREFEELRAGDILFIDTTHTVKIGSEVNWLLLEILPQLPPGVLVHLHDVFLPWEYPREWVVERGYYWAEQYLLQALLCENPRWEVVVAVHHLARMHRTRVRSLIPGVQLDAPARSCSVWLRRV